jgi:hypothetical protein
MLSTAIPVYQREKICFARDNKKEHKTFALEDNNRKFYLLNAVGNLLLNLCNGKNSLANIHKTLKKRFPDTSSEILQQDIVKLLTNMSIQGFVKWADDFNPFLPQELNFEFKISENICVKGATEDEFKDIMTLVKKVVPTGRENTNHDGFVVLANPIVYSGIYCDLMVRARMFNYSERFYFLEYDSEKIGLLCILDDYPSSTRGIVSLLVLKSDSNTCDNIKSLFKGAIANFNNTCHKFKCSLNTNHVVLNKIDTCLREIGFVREGVYQNEYGNGVDEWVYGKKITELIEPLK